MYNFKKILLEPFLIRAQKFLYTLGHFHEILPIKFMEFVLLWSY